MKRLLAGKRSGKFLKRWPDGLYVVGIELLMVALLTAVVWERK